VAGGLMLRPRFSAEGAPPPTLPRGGRPSCATPVRRRRSKLPWPWALAGVGAVLAAGLAGLALGPVRLPADGVVREALNLLPGVRLESGLTPLEASIVTQIRLPRVVLALLVGALLALAGSCYQGAFRNPLADPYLL